MILKYFLAITILIIISCAKPSFFKEEKKLLRIDGENYQVNTNDFNKDTNEPNFDYKKLITFINKYEKFATYQVDHKKNTPFYRVMGYSTKSDENACAIYSIEEKENNFFLINKKKCRYH